MIEKKMHMTNIEEPQQSAGIAELIQLLYRKKLFIALATGAVTVAAIVISLLLPESFKSTSVLLPETDKSKIAGLGGLSDLASLAGMGGPDGSGVKLYPTIIKSETVLKPVILKKYKTNEFRDSVNLIEYWKIQAKTPELAYESALNSLRDGLDVTMDIKTNVITVSFEAGEPQLTADIINGVTTELDKFMRTKRTTNASRQRQWIEDRLGEVKDDLAASENRLKDFRERNRVVAGSPLLLLEQDRLLREAQINASLFSELKKQFELIKIEEIKNMPIVNVMDPATPAAKKDKPKRGLIVIATFFLAFAGSIGYVYVNDRYAEKIASIMQRMRR